MNQHRRGSHTTRHCEAFQRLEPAGHLWSETACHQLTVMTSPLCSQGAGSYFTTLELLAKIAPDNLTFWWGVSERCAGGQSHMHQCLPMPNLPLIASIFPFATLWTLVSTMDPLTQGSQVCFRQNLHHVNANNNGCQKVSRQDSVFWELCYNNLEWVLGVSEGKGQVRLNTQELLVKGPRASDTSNPPAVKVAFF